MKLVPMTNENIDFEITYKTSRKVYMTGLLHNFLAENYAENPYYQI